MATDNTPGKTARRYNLAGWVMVAALAAGLLSNLYGRFALDLPLTRTPPTWPAFLHGQVTSEIADAMAKAPLPANAAKLERAASWLVAGDLGPRVRQGCPGWFFLVDELAPYPDAAAHAQARARIMADMRARLAARRIELFVVVVPDKTRIEHDHLCGLYRPAAFERRASDWVDALHAAGVPALDLDAALRAVGSPAYLRTDTHWSQTGAQAAAQATADAVRRQAWAGEVLQPHRQYTITRGPAAMRPGDLVRLAGLDWLPARLQPAPDMEAPAAFAPVVDPGEQSADDLFGDDDLSRVALIGTSFSQNSNFYPFLQAALQTPVADFAREGGEFAGSAQHYFKSDAFKHTPPRLIVWEIPERSLQRPLDAAETGLPALLGR